MTLLSICIPTYNRADLLEYCLKNLREMDKHGIDYEIVIVDHASTDHTPRIIAEASKRWNNIRSYRQLHQVGLVEQSTACMRLARGKYMMYVADDDKILADKVAGYVRSLETTPEVSALFTPWWAYDDAQEQIIHGYFKVPQRVAFKAAQPLEMLNFITSQTIFPEIGIYRTEALFSILVSHKGAAYEPLPRLYALLKKGDVVFETEPFYLEVATTKPQFSREGRINLDLTTSYLDNLRAGMEVMVARMMLDFGHAKIPGEFRNQMHEVLINYAHNRLKVAFNRATAAGQYMEAVEFAQRILLWEGVFRQDLVNLSNEMYGGAALQAAAWLYGGMSWLKQFYLCGFNKADEAIAFIKKKKPDVTIEQAAQDKILAHPEPENVFILVKTTAERKPFLMKFLPGNVVALEEMAQYCQIFPGPRNIDLL